MTRVIHTGDTHLGYQQYHSPERRTDFADAFRQVVDDAVADDVDAVVHAGDLFHDRRPDLPDLLHAIETLGELRTAEIPFLAVVGNHEGTRSAQWLDLFERLDLATRLGSEPVTLGDTAFYGLDFVPPSRRDELAYDFAAPDADHAALVSHGLFTPFAHADWETETVLAESTVDFDALLLGDNHHPDRAEVEGTWVTYCGSTERASADEREPRGYNIVEFDSGVAITRRGIDTREFVFLDVTLDADEGIERVRERVREADVTDAVVIVSIGGEGERVTPADVESFGAEQGALLTRVTDRRDLADPDADLDVSFADPDAAVRERLEDLGLSSAARSLDRTVRETATVADSNVRGEVERRVRDYLEDEPEAFATVEEANGGREPTTDSDSGGGDAEESVVDESDTGADTPDTSDEPGDATDDQVTMGDFQ